MNNIVFTITSSTFSNDFVRLGHTIHFISANSYQLKKVPEVCLLLLIGFAQRANIGIGFLVRGSRRLVVSLVNPHPATASSTSENSFIVGSAFPYGLGHRLSEGSDLNFADPNGAQTSQSECILFVCFV